MEARVAAARRGYSAEVATAKRGDFRRGRGYSPNGGTAEAGVSDASTTTAASAHAFDESSAAAAATTNPARSRASYSCTVGGGMSSSQTCRPPSCVGKKSGRISSVKDAASAPCKCILLCVCFESKFRKSDQPSDTAAEALTKCVVSWSHG